MAATDDYFWLMPDLFSKQRQALTQAGKRLSSELLEHETRVSVKVSRVRG